jgi:hypothetical protein
VPSWGSYSFAYGPLVVLVSLGLLVLVMRWGFSTGASLVRTQSTTPGTPGDYGVLVEVASPDDEAAAEAMLVALQAGHVDATLANTTDGLRVLVWPDDAARARTMLGMQA